MQVACLADIHSNHLALKAVMNDMKTRSIDLVFLLGDYILGPYGSNKTIDLIRELKNQYETYLIAGNIDDLHQAIENKASYIYPNLYDAYDLMTSDNISFIKALKKDQSLKLRSQSIDLVHNPSEDFVFEMNHHIEREKNPVNYETLSKISSGTDKDLIFFGHYHLYMDESIEGTRFICPSSVGMPFNGRPKAQYGILNLESGVFERCEVPYKVDQYFQSSQWIDFENRYSHLAAGYKKTLISGHHYL